jgi:hypothetical protein
MIFMAYLLPAIVPIWGLNAIIEFQFERAFEKAARVNTLHE